MNNDLQSELRDFLRTQREADVIGMLRRIVDERAQDKADEAEWRAEVRGNFRGHSLRIGELERDKEKIEIRMDRTGSWELEDLRERSKHTSRLVITTLIGVAVALVSGGVGVLVTLMMRK